MLATSFGLMLPEWLREVVKFDLCDMSTETLEQRMQIAISLASLNVRYATGGPFGAVVFDRTSKTVIGVGVNLVVSSGLSLAHAEVIALALAQFHFETYDLSQHNCELITSAEPCAMCYGAIHWAGVRSVACGARESDVRSIGFDEGRKPTDWVDQFTSRGIGVTRDIERNAAIKVLEEYKQAGGVIYNSANF